jgi:hypothetical protein
VESSIQIAAACGPVILAVMGVIVAFVPPSKAGVANKIWIASFIIVGLVTAPAVLYELRGSDQIMGRIWERVQGMSGPSKEGARFIMHAAPVNKETKTVEIGAINKGDLVARTNSSGATQQVLSPYLLSAKEEDEWFERAKAKLSTSGAGADFLRETGHSMTFEVNLTDDQLESVVAGQSYFYIFFVTSFQDELTPPGKRFLASMCIHYRGRLDMAQLCYGHNVSREAD